MQAILAAAAAHSVLVAALHVHPQHYAIPPSLSPSSPSAARPFHPTLVGEALAVSSPVSATAPKPLNAVVATRKAVAVLKGSTRVEGVVTLAQENDGATTVNVRVTGLAPGPHGFHLHEYGDTTKGCMSTGPHFNPNKKTHGAPGDEIRHAGDLGNIIANAEGVAEATIVDSQIPLSGPNAVVGRAFVVHELEDDLGKGGQELSLTTGNAGGRLACVSVVEKDKQRKAEEPKEEKVNGYCDSLFTMPLLIYAIVGG